MHAIISFHNSSDVHLQVKAILGPTVAIRNHGYASSESFMSVIFDPSDLDTFVLQTEDVLEFVDVNTEGISKNIVQAVSIPKPHPS